MPTPDRPPPGQRILYVLGNAGWTVVDRVVVTFALFFYLPPAGLGLPVRLEERAVFGMTLFGALMIAGRVVDSIADPVVAAWSDRGRSRFGRRRVFLMWGAVPLAAVTALLYFPPTDRASVANAVFLGVGLAAFFFLFTVYVTPYLALIPELARSSAARIDLTTQQAYAQLGGAALVMIATPMIVSALGGGVGGYQAGILLVCAAGAALMLLPVVAVRERADPGASGEPPRLVESLRLTLSSRPFRWYLGGNVAYWFGFNVVSSGALYFTTVLMRAEEGFQAAALGATFAVSGVFFAVWNVIGRRHGKRTALLLAGVAFVVALVALSFVRDRTSGLLAFALVGIPVAALLVLPNAALADCVDDDARRTATRREAMFFGAQGVLLKVNLGISTAVFAGLLAVWGRDVGDDLGVRLAGPVGAAVVLLGMGCFWKYPERDILGPNPPPDASQRGRPGGRPRRGAAASAASASGAPRGSDAGSLGAAAGPPGVTPPEG